MPALQDEDEQRDLLDADLDGELDLERDLLNVENADNEEPRAAIARDHKLAVDQESRQREEWLEKVLAIIKPSVIKGLACATTGMLMLLETGQVFTWTDKARVPSEVIFPSALSRQGHEDGDLRIRVVIEQIEAGEDHFAARSSSLRRNLYTWGANGSGQLGLEDTRPRASPCIVVSIEERVTDVTCGKAFTLCQTEIGHVYGWGANNKGQLGHRVHSESTMSGSLSSNQTQETAPTSSLPPGEMKGKHAGFSWGAFSPSSSLPPRSSPTSSPIPSLPFEGIGGQRKKPFDKVRETLGERSFAKARQFVLGEREGVRAKESIREPSNPFLAPVVHAVNTDVKMVLEPRLIPHLCREERQHNAERHADPSRGFRTLRMNARGEHAVAWTSKSSDEHAAVQTSREELVRLQHANASKQAQLVDLSLRHQRALRLWRGQRPQHGADVENEESLASSKHGDDRLRACTEAAELVCVSPSKEMHTLKSVDDFKNFTVSSAAKIDVEVVKDSGLAAVEDRLERAEAGLARKIAEMTGMEKHLEAIVARLKDAELELEDLNKENAQLRGQVVRIKLGRQARISELAKLQDLLPSSLGTEAKLDRSANLNAAISRDTRDLDELENQTLEGIKTRIALEESAGEQRRALDSLASEQVAKELQIHEIETRICMYKRIQLRRQERLQQNYTASLQALWKKAIAETHCVWKTCIVPANVFALLQERSASRGNQEPPLDQHQLVEEAVAESDALLAKAREKAIEVIDSLRQQNRSLETPRILAGYAGLPRGWTNDQASLTLYAPQNATAGSGGSNSARQMLMLMSRVSFSAMPGDEIMVGSISIALDGFGANSERANSERSLYQDVLVTLYEDRDGSPSTLVSKEHVQLNRVSAKAAYSVRTFTFETPSTLVAHSMQGGRAFFWIALISPRPNGIVRIFGQNSIGGTLRDVQQVRGSSMSLWVTLDRETNEPPESLGIVSALSRRPSPLHPFLSAHALSVCDRCFRLIDAVIEERLQVNTMLKSKIDCTEIKKVAQEFAQSRIMMMS